MTPLRGCRQIGFRDVRQLYFRHSGESRNPESLNAAERLGYENPLDSGFRRNDVQFDDTP